MIPFVIVGVLAYGAMAVILGYYLGATEDYRVRRGDDLEADADAEMLDEAVHRG